MESPDADPTSVPHAENVVERLTVSSPNLGPVDGGPKELRSLEKQLKKEPSVVIAELLRHHHDVKTIEFLSNAADEISRLQEQAKTLDISLKQSSALIGRTRKAGGDTTELLEQSRSLSRQTREIKCILKKLSQEILTQHLSAVPQADPERLAADPSSVTLSAPGQFLPSLNLAVAGADELEITECEDAAVWSKYVSGHPNSTHYHQYEWKGIIDRNFQQQTSYLIARDAKGNVVGVAPVTHMKSLVFGSFMLSMPFLIYGGPIADNREISDLLAMHINALAVASGCSHTELREVHQRDGWQQSTEKVAMVLELPDDLQLLNDRLGTKVRAQVKRAAREKPVLELGSKDLIPEFYHVFSRKMREHGTPVYAQTFFEDMISTFPGSTQIAVVRLSGKPVAAAFLVSHRNTLEVPWAASIRKHDGSGINMYMYHALLEEAVRRGFRYFDFGRSSRNSPTLRFKKQWGAEARQLHWHFKSTSEETRPQTEKTSIPLAVAIKTWRILPLWVANSLGPHIARQLPW